MARTNIKKSREACWVPCTIAEYSDESHLILPATRESLQVVSDKSKVNEFRHGQFTRETDDNVFHAQWVKRHWLDWKNVSIEHDDGRVEDPAACTIENRMILANSRALSFLLWLQEASRQLAAQVDQVRQTERDQFREPHQVSTGESGPEL